MIGLIVSGHGNFASGILSSIKLIAGDQEKVIGVDFEQGKGSEELKTNIENGIKELDCSEILVLTDLAGGSPFNVSSLISENINDKDIKVIAGTNLPMLLEVSLMRDGVTLDELIETAKSSGSTGIKEYGRKKIQKESEDFDGI